MGSCRSISPNRLRSGSSAASKSTDAVEPVRRVRSYRVMDNQAHTKQVMPPANFAVLGGGKIAYVRTLKSEEAKDLFPGLPPVTPGMKLWALLAADGTPIMLSDSR